MDTRREEKVAILKRWFQEIWGERKLQTVDELMHPDATFHGCGNFDFEEVHGPAEFRQYAEGMLGAFSNIEPMIEDTVCEDDKIAARFRVKARHSGALAGLEPTGAEVTMSGMAIARIADGKIIEGWNLWDQMGMFKHLSQLQGDRSTEPLRGAA
jgi:predicted ester cyclase